MRRFHEFWEKVDKIEMDPLPFADQEIMQAVLHHFPETYGTLPSEWDRNLGNGWRRTPHKMLEQEEAAGMLHFQGGAGRRKERNYFSEGFDQYCSRTSVCRNNPKYREMVTRSWGLGDFYTRLTWKWAKYFGKSAIPPGEEGFKLQFIALTAKPPRNGTHAQVEATI
jgi:hypothetical protein